MGSTGQSPGGAAARGRAGLAVGVGLVVVLGFGSLAVVLQPEPAVSQPLPFSHAIHAGDIGLDCQFCHATARRSSVAGVPSMETCVGCHIEVTPEREAIVTLLAHWERGEPIAWNQVYDLPEYVRFSHRPHVTGDVDCSVCHGDVARTETMRRERDLTMGWCVDCHDRNEASIDCITCHY